MKISKIFHFLYFSVLSIPLLSIPIFAIYSMNHEISGNSINTSGYVYEQRYNTNEVETTSDLVVGNIYKWTYIIDHTLTGNSRLTQVSAFYCFDFNATDYSAIAPNGTYLNVRINPSSNNISVSADNNSNFSLNLPYTNDTESITFYAVYYTDDRLYNFTIEESDWLLADYVYKEGIVLDDEDIVSQFIYSEYNFMDKYLPMYKFAPFNGIYSWISNTFFTGNAPIVFTIFYQWFAYWLFVSLCWLIFDVLMYVPLVVHRWLDKGALE